MSERKRYALPIGVFMILLKDDEVLLLERTATGYMDGLFSLPAGALDDDEEIIKAAIRECKEEVDVDVKEEHVTLLNVQHCQVGEHKWVNLFFVTEVWEGEPRVCEPHKHGEIRWAHLDELPENIVPYVEKGLKNIQNKNNYAHFGW